MLLFFNWLTIKSAQLERDAARPLGLFMEASRNEFELFAVEMRASLVPARLLFRWNRPKAFGMKPEDRQPRRLFALMVAVGMGRADASAQQAADQTCDGSPEQRHGRKNSLQGAVAFSH